MSDKSLSFTVLKSKIGREGDTMRKWGLFPTRSTLRKKLSLFAILNMAYGSQHFAPSVVKVFGHMVALENSRNEGCLKCGNRCQNRMVIHQSYKNLLI